MKFQPLRKLEARTSPDALVKARKLYEQDSLNIKLKTLREKYGIKQDNVDNFTQTAVSKLERRKDVKISTLVDYLESLGFGIEISALPKGKKHVREVLLRI